MKYVNNKGHGRVNFDYFRFHAYDLQYKKMYGNIQ